MGMSTLARWSARSVEGFPSGCNGKPKNASPRTPGNGAWLCACDVIRPPNDFPPAISIRPGHCRAACAAAARTVA